MKNRIIKNLSDNFSTLNDMYSLGFEDAKTLAGFNDLKATLESYSPEQIREFQSDLTKGLSTGIVGLSNLSPRDIAQLQSEILTIAEEVIEEKDRMLERLAEERQSEAARSLSSASSSESRTPEASPEFFGPLAGAGSSITSPMAAEYDDDPDLTAAMAASMLVSPTSISEDELAEEAAMARMMAESMHDSPASAIDMTSPLDRSLDFTPPTPLDSLAAKMEYLDTNKLASDRNSEGFKASIASDLTDVNSDEYYSNRLIMQILTKRFLTNDRVIIGKEIEYQEGEGFAKPEDVAKLIAQTEAMAPGQVLIQPMLRVNAEGRAPHWISTVITKDTSGNLQLTCADSMFNNHAPDGSVNQHRALEVLTRTLGISSANVRNISSYQQGNGSDCGAWLIENTSRITEQLLRKESPAMLTKKDTDRSLAKAMRGFHETEYRALVIESLSPTIARSRPLTPSPAPSSDRAATKPRGLA